MELFGSSGIRGVAGEELTAPFVGRVAAATGTALDETRVAVARDTRTTGRLFADAAASALAAVGCDVLRLGVVPTPCAQAYAEWEGVPVIVITASHNPPQYNGIKLIGSDGVELSRTTLERVERQLHDERAEPVAWNRVGTTRPVDGVPRRYVDELLAELERDGTRGRIAGAGLTVALDPGHGAGCVTSPPFFRRLGCDVRTVNAQPDGHFPGRNPEPVREHLGDLRRLVRTTDADVGIAHDGDGDRAIFVDEHGGHIEGDVALAALAAAELTAGDIAVSAVNVSQRLIDTAEAVGAVVDLTPIGSTNIISHIGELRTQGASVPIAGEGNGGILFPRFRLARDGAYAAARFLDLLVDRPASDVAAEHDGYANARVNIEYDTDEERERLLSAARAYAEDADATLTTIDGFRLDYGDGWVLARPSGTEPLVRLAAEARDEARARALLDGMHEAMRDSE